MNERVLKLAAQVGLLNEDSQGFYIEQRAGEQEVADFAESLIREVLMFNRANLMDENDPEDNSEFAQFYTKGWNAKTLDIDEFLKNFFGVK
jgi:hypothetical protein